jgi:glycerol-3-phosphate cytidylyltransferase
MGDDWVGKFDDLSDCCEVLYLPRSKDISTTELKAALIQHLLASKIDEITRASERLNALIGNLRTLPQARALRVKPPAKAS